MPLMMYISTFNSSLPTAFTEATSFRHVHLNSDFDVIYEEVKARQGLVNAIYYVLKLDGLNEGLVDVSYVVMTARQL